MGARTARRLLRDAMYRPVEVVWVDAHGQESWVELDQLTETVHDEFEVHTVGLVVAVGRKQFTVTIGVASNGMAAGALTIPLAWVKTVRVLS